MNLIILALATYRTARAITQDEIFRPAQEAIQSAPLPAKLQYLASCPHCLAPYIAATFLAAGHYAPRATKVLTTALAAAAVSSLITDYSERPAVRATPVVPQSQSQGTPPPLL